MYFKTPSLYLTTKDASEEKRVTAYLLARLSTKFGSSTILGLFDVKSVQKFNLWKFNTAVWFVILAFAKFSEENERLMTLQVGSPN